MFKDLVESRHCNCEDELQKAMACYCFGPLISSELDSYKEKWSSHYIRKSVSNKIFGHPDYFFPGSNACDNSSAIIKKDVDVISDFINENNGESNKDDSVFINNCDYVFRELDLPLCSDVDTTKANFLYLLEVAV